MQPSANTSMLAQDGHTGALPKLAMETFCFFCVWVRHAHSHEKA